MKLNKTNREEIIAAAIFAAFKTRDEDHAKARTALADALYLIEHGTVEKTAAKLPREWQSRQDGFKITCDGFATWRSGDGAPNNLKLSRSRPFPPHYYEMKVSKNHALYADAQVVAKEYSTIEAAKKELRTKLHARVHSVTTTERLREAWPEGAKFMPAEVEKVPSNLPVPHDLVASVNALMGVKAKAKRIA